MKGADLSVLMANYNHGRFLAESLQAIEDQAYPLREIIILDDASTDDSMAILREFQKRLCNVTLIRNERNMGVVHAADTLLSLASKGYVYFAAADDRVLPEFFQRSMSLLSKYPEAGLCSGLCTVIDESSGNIGLLQSGVMSDADCYITPQGVADLLSRNLPWFVGGTTIYRRQCLIDIGGFRPELEAFIDGFASLVIALKYGCCFIPNPLAAWRRMESGYAARCSADRANWERIIRKVVRLMRTSYDDVFPPGYAGAWERRQLYGTALTDLTSKHHIRSEDLRRYWSQEGRVRKTAYRLVQRVLDRWFVTQNLWLAAKYRQPIYPMIANGLRKVAQKFR